MFVKLLVLEVVNRRGIGGHGQHWDAKVPAYCGRGRTSPLGWFYNFDRDRLSHFFTSEEGEVRICRLRLFDRKLGKLNALNRIDESSCIDEQPFSISHSRLASNA